MSVLKNDVRSTSRYVKLLMDSGASTSIIYDSFVHTNKLNTTTLPRISGPQCLNLFQAKVKIKLPKLNFTHHVFVRFQVTRQKSPCDVCLAEIYYRNLK